MTDKKDISFKLKSVKWYVAEVSMSYLHVNKDTTAKEILAHVYGYKSNGIIIKSLLINKDGDSFNYTLMTDKNTSVAFVKDGDCIQIINEDIFIVTKEEQDRRQKWLKENT